MGPPSQNSEIIITKSTKIKDKSESYQSPNEIKSVHQGHPQTHQAHWYEIIPVLINRWKDKDGVLCMHHRIYLIQKNDENPPVSWSCGPIPLMWSFSTQQWALVLHSYFSGLMVGQIKGWRNLPLGKPFSYLWVAVIPASSQVLHDSGFASMLGLCWGRGGFLSFANSTSGRTYSLEWTFHLLWRPAMALASQMVLYIQALMLDLSHSQAQRNFSLFFLLLFCKSTVYLHLSPTKNENHLIEFLELKITVWEI